MALSSTPTLTQIRAEIAGNSSLTTSSSQIQGLKGCLQAAIPGGFKRTTLSLSNSTDIDGAGRNQKDFNAYEQKTPYIYFGSSSWSYASDNSYADMTVYFNCDLTISVSVNPTYNSSYVSVTAYSFPFFHSSNSYRAHPITGYNEALRIFRVTFDTSNINVSTYVSPAFSTNYDYQSSTVSTTTDSTANYIVGSGGPSGLGPDPGGLGPDP